MTLEPIASYLRSHRKESGLSQQEVAEILGYMTEIQVSRHERMVTTPSLLVALGYEVIFRVPLSELFSGVYQTIEADIEARLSVLEAQLNDSTPKGRKAASTARKIEFLCGRKELKSI